MVDRLKGAKLNGSSLKVGFFFVKVFCEYLMCQGGENNEKRSRGLDIPRFWLLKPQRRPCKPGNMEPERIIQLLLPLSHD